MQEMTFGLRLKDEMVGVRRMTFQVEGTACARHRWPEQARNIWLTKVVQEVLDH